MTRPRSADRLARLLSIVPWVVARDGPLVSEVCQRFGISERELIADLNLLFMCGIYPYTPDALIEVDMDDGRVWVRFADWFRRPLRLTEVEALALATAARARLGVPEGEGGATEGGGVAGQATTEAGGRDGAARSTARAGPLASAVSKLEAALGLGVGEALAVEVGEASEAVLGTLAEAVTDRRKVLLDYYSFGRDQPGERVVQPWRVFSSEGHWYLLAWCEKVGGKRLFRVDRVRSATLAEGTFVAPADAGPVPTYESRPEDPVVVLDLAPGARWVAGQYPNEEAEDLGGGYMRVRLRASSTAWLERLLLRAGPDITVVSGAEGVAQAAARRVLAIYGDVTSER